MDLHRVISTETYPLEQFTSLPHIKTVILIKHKVALITLRQNYIDKWENDIKREEIEKEGSKAIFWMIKNDRKALYL